LVTTGSGKKVLLTGDAVWVRENYQGPAPKSFWVRHLEENADQAWASTLKIHEFSEKNPEALIIPGHDPHLWKELPSEIR
jgi:glyoxylase-like metal-dependent hydrolase (beta-lactamase superfamily II)